MLATKSFAPILFRGVSRASLSLQSWQPRVNHNNIAASATFVALITPARFISALGCIFLAFHLRLYTQSGIHEDSCLVSLISLEVFDRTSGTLIARTAFTPICRHTSYLVLGLGFSWLRISVISLVRAFLTSSRSPFISFWI